MGDKEKINLLAISSSPVSDGHTEALLSAFATRALALNADVEVIRLVDHPAPRPSGKLEGWKPDEFWGQKLKEADGFVIATPVYWFGPPGLLKDWIDNLTPLTYHYDLDGKAAGFLIYGPEGGASSLAQYLGLVANNVGLVVPPYGLIWQEGPHKTGNNAWVYRAAPALADNMITLLTALMEYTAVDRAFVQDGVRRYRAKGKRIPILPNEPEEEIVEDGIKEGVV